MSETRKPIEVWLKRLPQKRGTKNSKSFAYKVEVFSACCWVKGWTPTGNKYWFPKLPLHTQSRHYYWESRYRLKINGRWHSPKSKYTTFTLLEALLIFKNLEVV